MSNGFDLTRSCEEQGLTGSELQKCKDYQKKYKSIGAPSDVDLTGGGYYQKTYLPKRRAEQDAKGFLPWLFETTGGEEITKLWNQSRVDYNNAAASDDTKFKEKRQELLGIASKNLKDIYDNAYISKSPLFQQGKNFNREELYNIWRQQEGFKEHYLSPLGRSGDKWKESYNAALEQYSNQQLQKADDKVKDLYGENVLNDYIKNGRDISKINLNLFDKKIIDEAVKEAQLNAAKRFLDTTNEDDVSRVLYPALDKYLFSEEDKDEMGLLPNQRVAYDNEQIKQQLMANGCFSYSTVEEIKPGQEVECKGKKYKLREYQTGEQMARKYNDGMKDLQARADKIQNDINEAQQKTAPLLKEINELKNKLENYGELTADSGFLARKGYNDLVEQYKAKIEEYNGSDAAKQLDKLNARANLIYEESKLLEEEGQKLNDYGMILEAGMLNYNIWDKTKATITSQFIDPVSGFFADIDAELGKAFNSYDKERYDREKEVAVNYWKLSSERMEDFANFGSKDFGKDGFSVSRYLLNMAADNSPSILATLIPSGVAGLVGQRLMSGLSGMAAKQAYQSALAVGNKVTQGIFFVSGSTDQWGKLSLANIEGEKKIAEFQERLKDENLTPAMRASILEEMEYYQNLKSDSLLRRGLGSILYGGMDMLGERVGSLRVVNNLQKLGPVYKTQGLFGAWRKSAIDGIKATLGSGYRFTAGIGAELLEESLVNLGTAFVDRNILGLNKGYLDDFTTDFALNTAFTSIAMQGPFMSQNVMNGLRYELSTAAQRKSQRTLHGKLMGLQKQLDDAKLNPDLLTKNQISEINAEMDNLFQQSTISDFVTMNNFTKLDQTQRENLVAVSSEITSLEKDLYNLTQNPEFGSKDFLNNIKDLEAQLKELDAKKADILKSQKLTEFEQQADNARKDNKVLQTVDGIIAKSRVQLYEAALDITNFQFDGDTITLSDQESIDNYIKENNITDASEIEGINTNSAFVNPKTGQIVVNQQSIYNTIMDARTSTSDAFTAAIAPLHELLHAQIKSSGLFDIKNDAKLQSSIESSVIGLTDLINSKVEDGNISKERGKEILNRINQYKTDGKYNIEEVLTTFSEAVIAGDLKQNDFKNLFGVKSMLNGIFGKINGAPSSVLNPFTSTQGVFSFVSDFTNKLGNVDFNVKQTYTLDSTGRMKRNIAEDQSLIFAQAGDIKSRLDQYVQNEDGGKKYESKEDFQKSDDMANAMNEIENTNLLDGLIKQGVSQEYLDMNPEFVQEAKQRIGEKFLSEFDPNKNESLFGWLTGPTAGGQSILNFAKGDVQNVGKKNIPTQSISDPRAKEIAEQTTDDTTTTKKEVTPTINAFDFLKKSDPNFDSKKFENDFIEAQKVLAKEKGINLADPNLTPKQRMEVVPYQVLADAIGIPVKKLTDPKANLTPAEASKAQRVLTAAKPFIKNVVLSKAYTDVTTVASKKKGGKPVKVGGETLGLGTKILNTFFNPPKRLGSGKKVRTPKQFDNKKFDEAIGVKDGKVSPDFDARNSQIIKGLLKAVAEQMGARATSKTLDAGPQTQDVAKTQAVLDSMKSGLVFSKMPTLQKTLLNNPDYKKLLGKNTTQAKKELTNIVQTAVDNAVQLNELGQYNIEDAKFVEQVLKDAEATLKPLVLEAKAITVGLQLQNQLGKDKFRVVNKGIEKNNQKTDYQTEINVGTKNKPDFRPFNVEIKAAGAQLGSITVSDFNLENGNFTVNNNPISKKEVKDLLKKLDGPAFKQVVESITGIQNYTLNTPLTREQKNLLIANKNLIGDKSIQQLISNPDIGGNFTMADVAKIYANKSTPTYYMQIEGKGLFAIGKDVYKIGVPSLSDVKTEFYVRPVFDQIGKSGNYKINLRIIPQSTGPQGLKSIEKSGKDITNVNDQRNIVESANIQFSKNPLNKKGLDGINKTLENGQKFKDSPKGKKAIENLKNNQPKNLDKDFNDIIQDVKGIKSEARYSDIAARREGRGKGRFRFFLPPGAEDFKGLIYNFLGKGKKGEKQFEFFDNNLIKPYQQAVAQIERFRRALKADYATLLKGNPDARKKLNKEIPTKGKTKFTYDQAVRAFLMDQSGFDLTEAGLSKRDAKLLVDTIANDQTMLDFAQGLQLITKQDTWLKPNGGFDVQTIQSDLHRLTSGEGRKKFLENSGFMQNSADIFSKANLNKIEAAYGVGVREAIEDMMYRMKNGTNRPSGSNRLTNAFNNWVNRSIGAIMFFNRKSALLQTISSINFINWSDNNPLKAAAAFANQKQYWSDFATIFNSPKLKERRAGLKGDINEAELASAVEGATNKAEAALSWLLKKGFLPTQMADSFAIASGGATFYRNRINTYKKQGLSDVEAEKRAFEDFSRISEESQQSADPSMISEQQASPLGRLILAFQNTPMQYTRLMKRAGQDLINGRGDAKTHISKIIYYGAVQNFMFAALQNALFALVPGFGGEDEEEEIEDKSQKKYVRIANNMVDTVLRGSGIYGAIASTLKNTVMAYMENEKKDPFAKDNADILIAAVNLSPPIGSKVRKLNNALRTKEFEKDVIEERGWEITRDGRLNLSPSYRVLGSTAEALANIPIERLIAEISALTEMTDERNTNLERVALGLGWRTWDLGIRNEEHDQIKLEAKERKKKERSEELKRKREEEKRLKEEARFEGLTNKEINALKRRDQIEALTKQQQIDSLLKLGVSKKDIRALRLESDRIDKIIELNTK